MEMKEMFERVKRASRGLTLLTDEARNSVLIDVAQAIVDRQETILSANADDLSRMDPANPLYDRLQLTPARLEAIAQDKRNVATRPTPVGHVTKQKTLPNGLRLCRVSVPFGVIGMIYEARPNVTFDVFSLCFKSGNACVLKGGKDADSSNRAAVEVIHDVLCSHGLDPDVVTLLPATHEATGAMLTAVGYIDLCIPRGGRRLIDFVRDNARVPVIETGAGVVHTYFDKDGDLEMGRRIVCNAKTRRVSVCNALDSLIIHRSRLKDLPALVEPLLTHTPPVTLYLDDEAYNALTSASLSAAATIPSPSGEGPSASVATIPSPSGEGPSAALLQKATVDSYGTEFMDYKMAVKTVGSLDEALDHIGRYGSGHSEAIVTASEEAARRFQQHVDAACVYWNAPTSFTDGAQFGLGAEIGISTQKLGPRGPMALEEITTYKWLIEGEGQTRP